MDIIAMIQEYNSNRRYLAGKEEAEDIFKWQLEAIKNIMHTNWFKEIRNFFIRELQLSQERLMTSKYDNIQWVQAEMKLAKRFVDFIDNLSNYKID